MLHPSIIVSALFLTTFCCREVSSTELVIGFLTPMEGAWNAGQTISGAVPVAVDFVNSFFYKTDIAYNVSFVWRNSGCDPGVALGAMSELLEHGVDVFVGPGCSAACEATQLLASNRHTAQVHIFSIPISLPLCGFAVKNSDASAQTVKQHLHH